MRRGWEEEEEWLWLSFLEKDGEITRGDGLVRERERERNFGFLCGDGRCARKSFWNGELCVAKKYTQAKLEE